MAADPKWLSPDELAAWLSLAGLMFKLPGALDSQLQRDSGLTHFEYLVLAGLSESEGRSRRMSDLAGWANGSLSRLSHVVKRLESRGFVERRPAEDDGRITVATLTDAGFAFLETAAPGHVAAVREYVIDALTPEQLAQLRVVADQILARVDPDKSC
ncbi:MarR family transcriptional regulator [Kribbella sandramycini]|uniref:MarR family transcriptional regulator n=1 Tax=Kribbella sandramycini TaxID=60450 RepID=A0A7Y4NXW3_9ACTN|nr:MarR family transcriptional regulator [Kribbella sandramycini]MBB6567502.1 DNA-binding MarR family transcriptional regulator [Kribbella sandramycini]NOL39891.1 MarR family transcriptional regulator [Kribbella sandramycini]